MSSRFQLTPRICLANSCHAVVFPTPAGPVINKCGGSEEILADFSDLITDLGNANSSNVSGAFEMSQLTMLQW